MDSIPVELLERIFWCLIPITSETPLADILDEKASIEDGRRALYNVMASCKAFYRIARPAFYHTISFQDHELEMSHVQRLIQTCVDRPETASYVREICLGEDGCTLCDPSCVSTESFDLEAFQAATDRIDVTPQLRADIKAALGQGSHDAVIALLLGLCVNLDSLNATYWFVGSSLVTRLADELSSIQSAIQGTAERRRPLQRLQTFRMRCSCFEQFIDIRDFVPYFRLSSLKVFEGVGVTDHSKSRALFAGVRSNLRSLDISDVSFESGALDWSLAIFPDLEELIMRIWSAYSRCEPTPDAIGDVLRRHGSRLQRLVIQHWRRPDTAIEEGRDDKVLGSLITMEKLRTLHVTWDALFGHTLFINQFSTHRADTGYLEDTLPRSLQELGISLMPHDPTHIPHLDRQLQTLMESERFAQLRLIRVSRTQPFSLPCPPRWHSHVDESRPDRWGGIRINLVLWCESEVSPKLSSYI